MKLKICKREVDLKLVTQFNNATIVSSFEEATKFLEANNFVGCVWGYNQFTKHWTRIYESPTGDAAWWARICKYYEEE